MLVGAWVWEMHPDGITQWDTNTTIEKSNFPLSASRREQTVIPVFLLITSSTQTHMEKFNHKKCTRDDPMLTILNVCIYIYVQ